MAYDLSPITEEKALAVITSAPGLKQPQILDILRGPLEYYTQEDVREDGTLISVGDVIQRPHLDLSEALGRLRRDGKVSFEPRVGWRLC